MSHTLTVQSSYAAAMKRAVMLNTVMYTSLVADAGAAAGRAGKRPQRVTRVLSAVPELARAIVTGAGQHVPPVRTWGARSGWPLRRRMRGWSRGPGAPGAPRRTARGQRPDADAAVVGAAATYSFVAFTSSIVTSPSCPLHECRRYALCVSQILTMRSSDPVMMRSPVLSKVQQYTALRWPRPARTGASARTPSAVGNAVRPRARAAAGVARLRRSERHRTARQRPQRPVQRVPRGAGLPRFTSPQRAPGTPGAGWLLFALSRATVASRAAGAWLYRSTSSPKGTAWRPPKMS